MQFLEISLGAEGLVERVEHRSGEANVEYAAHK